MDERTQPGMPEDRVEGEEPEESAVRRRNRVNLIELAYERLEEFIVDCTLKPGFMLTIQDLQAMTGFGRTPVHQAVSRLAADTLILVRPRHGIQIAPIDLARDRLLLGLRKDLERFVVRLAAERSGPTHRNQAIHLERLLRERRDGMEIGEFNLIDRRIDRLILAAAGEPFLEHTLRPLHTIFRRIGWIYHTHAAGKPGADLSIDRHLAILSALAGRRVEEAVEASDGLMDFMDGVLLALERSVEPALLDCRLMDDAL
ncbi:GntR family transcriptional regulator [Azospirillum sp. SYSU D00513]|uniref:GntR family transcriptional regulator n=1 Tax=Azospirillum sp. SYSU D00513 TaxID=2812561 RepID=UPI001A9580DC|nr:GntR family transcriptional regulator [Azospirillum sp. SYSU D00513]